MNPGEGIIRNANLSEMYEKFKSYMYIGVRNVLVTWKYFLATFVGDSHWWKAEWQQFDFAMWDKFLWISGFMLQRQQPQLKEQRREHQLNLTRIQYKQHTRPQKEPVRTNVCIFYQIIKLSTSKGIILFKWILLKMAIRSEDNIAV